MKLWQLFSFSPESLVMSTMGLKVLVELFMRHVVRVQVWIASFSSPPLQTLSTAGAWPHAVLWLCWCPGHAGAESLPGTPSWRPDPAAWAMHAKQGSL